MRFNPWLFSLVGLSVALSWYFASRGPVSATPNAPCLTDGDCRSGERCVVVPKGDGFATLGTCGERCEDDHGCGNGWTCNAWVDDRKYLSPSRGRAADAARVKVCQHHLVVP